MKGALRIFLSLLLSCCLFIFPVLSSLSSLSNARLIEWTVTGVLLYIAYTLAILLLFSLTNIGKALFWIRLGFRKISFIVYPFLIVRRESVSFRKVLNPLRVVENIYPGDFVEGLEEVYDEAKASDTLIKYEIWSLVVQTIILLAFAAILLVLGFVYLIPSIGVAFVPLYFLNSLDTVTYHGSLTRIKKLRRRKGVLYYLLLDRIASSTRLTPLYSLAEKRIYEEAEIPDNFGYFQIRILSHLYMLKTDKTNEDYELLPSTEAYIKERLLDGSKIDFGSDAGSATWDFMKIYMCYAMIFDKKDALASIVHEMYRLSDRYKPLVLSSTIRLNGIRKLIQWYIDVARFRKIDASRRGYVSGNEVVRRDHFLYKFASYRTVYDDIVRKITDMCIVYEGKAGHG